MAAIFRISVDVSGQAAYPAANAPQVVIPFEPKTIMILLEDTTDDAFASFDGSNDHLHMVPGTPGAGVRFEQRTRNVWLRRGAAGTPATNVQVIAEA